jgi:hypothetical protein
MMRPRLPFMRPLFDMEYSPAREQKCLLRLRRFVREIKDSDRGHEVVRQCLR